MKKMVALIGLVLNLSATPGCAHFTHHHSEYRNIQLESFDYAWSRIGETYYDASMNGLDWEALRDELRPQAEKATTNAELAEILRDMMARIGESHFQIIPLNVYEPDTPPVENLEEAQEPSLPPEAEADPNFHGNLGIKIKIIGEQVIVREVNEDSNAYEKGVRVGWALTAVDDVELAPTLTKISEFATTDRDREFYGTRQVNELLIPTRNAPMTLSMRDAENTPTLISVHPLELEGRIQETGMLPQRLTLFESKILEDSRIGYIRFSEWAPPIVERFTEAIQSFRSAGVTDGVIVDLRENPGGVAAMSMGVAGHFMSKKGHSLGVMSDRRTTLNLRVFPRPKSQRWEGRLVLLVDALSASTSEIFAAGMQDLDEAMVVGSTTAGKALASMIESLPNGDRIQFVIWNLTRTNGQRIEGEGVIPDLIVSTKAGDFSQGNDPTLQAAINSILNQDPHEDSSNQ